MDNHKINYICEVCGKVFHTDYRKDSTYKAQTQIRFCSRSCANHRRHTDKTKEKISNSIKISNKPRSEKQLNWAKTFASIRKEQKLNSLVKINGDTLDITYKELRDYGRLHPRCEMCGALPQSKRNTYYSNLIIDHDHKTNHFRGLLCSSCNRFLGYYENHKEQAEKYLSAINSTVECHSDTMEALGAAPRWPTI